MKPNIKKGNFVNEDGTFLGRHESYFFYTVGQRYGLGINLKTPVFVKEIIPDKNKVVLAPIEKISQKEILLENPNLVNKEDIVKSSDIFVKIHYRKQPILAKKINIIDENTLSVELKDLATAVAPGQSAVFYKDGLVLGGGIIK